MDKSSISEDPVGQTIAKDTFEPSCPYRQPGTDQGPLYRFIEDFDDNSCPYVGDSFGGRSYINVSEPRHCSQNCACHLLEASERYAFTIFKNSTTIVLKIHHYYLSSGLAAIFPFARDKISNGFFLLKHLDYLEECLRVFQERRRSPLFYKTYATHEADRLVAGLSLLTESLLNDPQVFASFGYQRLYDDGCLSYEQWKKFHSSWTNENIDLLEASYDSYNDDLDLSHPSSHNAGNKSRDGTMLMPWSYFHPVVGFMLNRCRRERCKPMREDFSLRKSEEYPVEMLRWLEPRQAFRNWCQSQQRLRRFHVAFQKEHHRIARCPDVSDDWSCLHQELAYQKGIGVLRGLCKGQTPSTVSETICFLAIAKAMSVATDEVFNFVCNVSDFSRDLGRWQLLFKMEDGTLSTFRNATACIWNVNLEDTPVQNPDPSTLMKYCDLAYSIVQKADYSFEFSSYGSHRLLASQEDWRSKVPILEAEIDSPYIDDQIPKASYEKLYPISSDAHRFPWYQDRDPLPIRVPGVPIREAISNDRYVRSSNALVKLLMAGAIFSIIIIFLLGLRLDRDEPLRPVPSISKATVLYGRKQSMISAVEHMFKAVVAEIQPARPAIESIKRAAYTAIETAQLRTFQDLTNLLATHDFSHVSPTEHGCRHFRDCLIQACALWEPSYALQERYQVLESYLGLSHTATIVPNTPRPRLYAQILETEKSTQKTTTSDDGPSLINSPVSSPISISSNSVAAVDSSMVQSTHTSSPPLEGPPEPPKRSLPLQKTYCKDCNHDFEKICRYKRHRREKHEKVRFSCRMPPCLKTFSRNDYRDKHEARRHADRS